MTGNITKLVSLALLASLAACKAEGPKSTQAGVSAAHVSGNNEASPESSGQQSASGNNPSPAKDKGQAPQSISVPTESGTVLEITSDKLNAGLASGKNPASSEAGNNATAGKSDQGQESEPKISGNEQPLAIVIIDQRAPASDDRKDNQRPPIPLPEVKDIPLEPNTSYDIVIVESGKNGAPVPVETVQVVTPAEQPEITVINRVDSETVSVTVDLGDNPPGTDFALAVSPLDGSGAPVYIDPQTGSPVSDGKDPYAEVPAGAANPTSTATSTGGTSSASQGDDNTVTILVNLPQDSGSGVSVQSRNDTGLETELTAPVSPDTTPTTDSEVAAEESQNAEDDQEVADVLGANTETDTSTEAVAVEDSLPDLKATVKERHAKLAELRLKMKAERSELKAAEKRRAEARQHLKQLEKTKSSSASDLAAARTALSGAEEAVKKHQDNIDTLKAERKKLRETLGLAIGKLKAARDKVKKK